MTDLISRQELCEYALNQKSKSVTLNDIMRFNSAVRHGKWIFENRTWFYNPLLKCSSCGRRQFFARFDYCPYCGTRMDGE